MKQYTVKILEGGVVLEKWQTNEEGSTDKPNSYEKVFTNLSDALALITTENQ